jgi:hypothetical protein
MNVQMDRIGEVVNDTPELTGTAINGSLTSKQIQHSLEIGIDILCISYT